ASPALKEGQYTAQATQPSSLGNPPGTSEARTFTITTASPTVSMKAPTSPSNNTEPSFSGFASDSTQVTVRIYAGAKPEGTVLATATATPSGGEWTSGVASPALKEGQYTAQATQPSSVGNPPGTSEARTFTINTASPTVSMKAPTSPSNNTEPSFSGFASDSTQVTVRIYAGAKPEGTVLASATATPSGGEWSSGVVSPALKEGQY